MNGCPTDEMYSPTRHYACVLLVSGYLIAEFSAKNGLNQIPKVLLNCSHTDNHTKGTYSVVSANDPSGSIDITDRPINQSINQSFRRRLCSSLDHHRFLEIALKIDKIKLNTCNPVEESANVLLFRHYLIKCQRPDTV